jgi:hypothetical protein
LGIASLGKASPLLMAAAIILGFFLERFHESGVLSVAILAER